MGWLRLVGSFKLQVSFAKEPYKRDNILQKRPVIWARVGEAPKLPRAIRVGKNEGGGNKGPNSGSLSDFSPKFREFISDNISNNISKIPG